MTRYAVTFKVLAPKFKTDDRIKLVALEDGYSDFEDIRKILSLPLGVKVEEIKVMSLAIVE